MPMSDMKYIYESWIAYQKTCKFVHSVFRQTARSLTILFFTIVKSMQTNKEIFWTMKEKYLNDEAINMPINSHKSSIFKSHNTVHANKASSA